MVTKKCSALKREYLLHKEQADSDLNQRWSFCPQSIENVETPTPQDVPNPEADQAMSFPRRQRERWDAEQSANIPPQSDFQENVSSSPSNGITDVQIPGLLPDLDFVKTRHSQHTACEPTHLPKNDSQAAYEDGRMPMDCTQATVSEFNWPNSSSLNFGSGMFAPHAKEPRRILVAYRTLH